MQHTAEHYLSQLKALMPRGFAWPEEDDAIQCLLLAAFAEEFARVEGRGFDLIKELDPRLTLEMIADWERALGLPEECANPPDTLEERRNAAHEKFTRIGGQSRQYFIDLAARLGFEITITEFGPHTVQHGVDEPINGTDWYFIWQVNAPEETVTLATVESGVDEPLADWGNEILECMINRLKPAHTLALFNYQGV